MPVKMQSLRSSGPHEYGSSPRLVLSLPVGVEEYCGYGQPKSSLWPVASLECFEHREPEEEQEHSKVATKSKVFHCSFYLLRSIVCIFPALCGKAGLRVSLSKGHTAQVQRLFPCCLAAVWEILPGRAENRAAMKLSVHGRR
jgi:hypothetical protein